MPLRRLDPFVVLGQTASDRLVDFLQRRAGAFRRVAKKPGKIGKARVFAAYPIRPSSMTVHATSIAGLQLQVVPDLLGNRQSAPWTSL